MMKKKLPYNQLFFGPLITLIIDFNKLKKITKDNKRLFSKIVINSDKFPIMLTAPVCGKNRYSSFIY